MKKRRKNRRNTRNQHKKKHKSTIFFTEEVKNSQKKNTRNKSQNSIRKTQKPEKQKHYLPIYPKEIATPEELKELYGTRWTIEKTTTD